MELLGLFVGIPTAIALFADPRWLFAILSALSILALFLIWRTGQFSWHELLSGWSRIGWRWTLAFAVAVAAMAYVVMAVTYRGFTPNLTPERLRFLAILWVLYPLLSAFPQELIFRVLFFHRYGPLFTSRLQAGLTNAALFSLAHLMYWSPVVAVMTFAGGWIFADAYLKRGFPAAWLLHGVAGNVLFTMGMGEYFWSGNIVRPF